MSEFTFREFTNKVGNGVHKLMETDFETYLEFINDGVRVSLDEYYGDEEMRVIWICEFVNHELSLSDDSIVSKENLNEFILFLNEMIDARFHINQHLKKIEEYRV